MEMIHEVLGEAGEKAIEIVKRAQEHLGEMHDAYLAGELLRRFIGRWAQKSRRAGKSIEDIRGIQRYCEACEADERKRIETFPEIWAELHSEDFRRLLADVTASL
jgi:CHAD domain-containing protein